MAHTPDGITFHVNSDRASLERRCQGGIVDTADAGCKCSAGCCWFAAAPVVCLEKVSAAAIDARFELASSSRARPELRAAFLFVRPDMTSPLADAPTNICWSSSDDTSSNAFDLRTGTATAAAAAFVDDPLLLPRAASRSAAVFSSSAVVSCSFRRISSRLSPRWSAWSPFCG